MTKKTKHFQIVGVIGVLLAGLLTPIAVNATNGYFSHGYGTKSKALAGAGVATPMDAMDAALNPANMVFVGQQWHVGLAWFRPLRDYSVMGAPSGFPGTFGQVPGSFESDSEDFFIPNAAGNWMLSDDSSLGVTVYGNGGMNTDWKASDIGGGVGVYGAGDAGVDLAQLFINGTYARKFAGGKAAWGLSAILVYQRFEAEGVSTFAGVSNDPNNLTNRGHDDSFGYGLKIGVQGEVAPGFRLGASYQSKMWMDEYDDYSGLFAEEGDFDIPQTATAGLAYDFNETTTAMFDVQWIDYSDITAIANPQFPQFGACSIRTTLTDPNCLGGSNGIGFGWRDMTIYKLGVQWETGGGWTWRVGASVANRQPIPSSEVQFNILAPGVIKEHLTFGFTKALSDKSGLDFSFMYAPSNSVSGPNPLEAPGAQTIELEMKQYEFAVQYNKAF